MMKLNIIALPFYLLLFAACGTTKDAVETEIKDMVLNEDESIIWVNSYYSQCAGVAPMPCLMIQENETITEGAWKNTTGRIDGFDYQPGYKYKLVVRTVKLDPETIAADRATIKRVLVKEISKEMDVEYFRIHDIWALTAIGGKTIEITSQRPSIEVNANELRLFGNGTCNTINGRIDLLTPTELKFGPVISTKKFCPEQEIETAFLLELNKVANYTIKDLSLIMMDTKGNELLQFKKVD